LQLLLLPLLLYYYCSIPLVLQKIFVATPSENKTLTVNIDPSDTIDHLQSTISNKQPGLFVDDHDRLLFGSKQLQRGFSLADYNIQPESTVHVLSRMRGGHCQVPCGIFDDPAIVGELKQCAETIRKAMVQSSELHGSVGTDLVAMNQVVRWIGTKEEHAAKIIKLVAEYCLCQRVKKEVFSSDHDYMEALRSHHAVMQAAMKCKQVMDVTACDALDGAIATMAKMYAPSA
jgi:ubiquitin-small subunit ribosomal protein S27Ae